jgi:hypothetical protein
MNKEQYKKEVMKVWKNMAEHNRKWYIRIIHSITDFIDNI